MKTEVLLLDWAKAPSIPTPEHEALVRELMSYHCLCDTSCLLEVCPRTGRVYEKMPNSALHWSRVVEWPWILLNGEFDTTTSVLDAAGGHAVLQHGIAKRSKYVQNVDLNRHSVDAAGKAADILLIGNLLCWVEDIGKMGYYDEVFDRVVCCSVLEHTENPQTIVTELLRVLRPGGLLLLTLDVVINSLATAEFRIGIAEAVQLVESFGGEFLMPTEGLLMNYMPSGEILCCLLLKIRKGV